MCSRSKTLYLIKQETQTLEELMQSLWQNFPHCLHTTKAFTLQAIALALPETGIDDGLGNKGTPYDFSSTFLVGAAGADGGTGAVDWTVGPETIFTLTSGFSFSSTSAWTPFWGGAGVVGTSSVNSGLSASESIEARMLRDSLGSRVGIGGVDEATGGVEGVATGEGLNELLLDFKIPIASTEAGLAG